MALGLLYSDCCVALAVLARDIKPRQAEISYFVELWFAYWRALAISVVLLLVVMRDLVRLSNRFCGPLLRIRHAMRRLTAGEHVEPLQIREGDFWHDFAKEFNALMSHVQEESPHSSATPGDSDELLQEAL